MLKSVPFGTDYELTYLYAKDSIVLYPWAVLHASSYPGLSTTSPNRGNRRADVFYSDDDRRVYLRFLRQYTERHGLAVWAYCLMTNHVHLVVVPQREDSLAKALRDAHTVYAMRGPTPPRGNRAMSGKAGSTRTRLMNRTCGRLCATSSATPCTLASWPMRRTTRGPAQRPIAQTRPMTYYRTSFPR